MITTQPYDHDMFEDVLAFCKDEFNNEPAAANMWSAEWIYQPSTLPFLLKNSSRFQKDNGHFNLIFDGSKIIGCGGIYRSSFDKNVALAGVRTWLTKSHRNKSIIRDILLPSQRAWALEREIKNIALSFNSYNKNLIELFSRGQKYRDRTTAHLFSSNFRIIDFPVQIQDTTQWVIVEEFDNYQFNWSSLRSS